MTSPAKSSTPQLNIGEYVTVLSANLVHQSTLSALPAVNNKFIQTGVYANQADYPALYSQVGLVGANTFTGRTVSVAVFTNSNQKLVYGGGMFVAAGTSGSGVSAASGTTDPRSTVRWPQVLSWSGTGGDYLGYAEGYFWYTLGTSGVTARKSANGTSWSSITVPFNSTYYSGGTVGGVSTIVAVDKSTSKQVKTSTNLGSTWATATTLPITGNISAVCYGNGLFVFGSSAGEIYTSTNLSTFTSRTSGTSTGIVHPIVYGNGLYVYSHLAGTGTSTDGTSWTYTPQTFTGSSLNDLAYGNGVYAIITNNTYYYSNNATNWTSALTATSSTYDNMAYGQNCFVIICPNGGTYGAQTSESGNHLESTYYDSNTQFYVPTFTSTDLLTVQATSTLLSSAVYTTTYVRAKVMTTIKKLSSPQVEFGEYFTAIAANTIHQGSKVASSAQTDANNSSVFIQSNGFYNQADYPDLYNRLGSIGSYPVTSKTNTYTNGQAIYTFSYGNGVYFGGCSAATTTTGNIILTSTDAINWTSRSSGFPGNSYALLGIAYGNPTANATGVYINGGQYGYVGTSTDAITWTAGTTGASGSPLVNNTSGVTDIYSIIYGNGLFVYAGTGGYIGTTTNAITWTARTSGNTSGGSGTTTRINALAYGNGLYIYVGYGGVIGKTTNPNGTSWTVNSSFTSSTIFALVYGNGLFLAGGNGGSLFSSTDGTTWSTKTSGTTSTIKTLTYGNGLYVYGGDNGALATSTDGTSWISKNSNTTTTIQASTYGNGVFVLGTSIISTSYILTSNSNFGGDYSPYYDATTQFYVPTLTESSTLTLQATTTLLSSAIYTTYVRAK